MCIILLAQASTRINEMNLMEVFYIHFAIFINMLSVVIEPLALETSAVISCFSMGPTIDSVKGIITNLILIYFGLLRKIFE